MKKKSYLEHQAYPIRSSLTSVAETINPKAETKKATTPMPINIQGRTEK
jgi:hypothetical protein